MNENIKTHYNYPEIINKLEAKGLILRGGLPVAVRYKNYKL
jgi:hypothetical protein